MSRTAFWAFVTAIIIAPWSAAAQTPPPPHFSAPVATRANPETVVLDARDTARGLMYTHMRIPVHPGPFTLVYPKWIPGEHGPSGPLSDLAEIRISGNGQTIPWRRDKYDLYAFHITVPQGISNIAVNFTVLLNAPGDTMATRNVGVINWNRDVLYQANTNSHEDYFKPSLILPAGWDYACSIPGAKRTGDRIDFAVVPLNMLQDSPTDIGRYVKHFTLWSGGGTHQYMDLFAEGPEDLAVSPKLLAAYKNMMPEALALYGSRHWNVYHSLLALSDPIGFQGIEHHQSSDDRAPSDFMINPKEQTEGGDLLTHEFSHSWNGKYRRPYDLFTWNFQIPMADDLLWVYEGMNQYLGDVLKYRTGIDQPKNYPEYLASIYASMDTESGRSTTSIIETTTSAPWRYGGGGQYPSIRRTAGDFYAEGELIWLDADTIIRAGTHGRKSLDDFLHLFTAPPVTGPITKTYTRADVESLLRQVYPYNWHGFFERYVYQVSAHPPTDMLARSGWRFVYTSKPNMYGAVSEALRHSVSRWFDLGVSFGADGTVRDVRENSPAWSAQLAPGMKIAAINGRAWSSDVLDNALVAAQHDRTPISLIVVKDGYYNTLTVNYHGGLRYPHLVRIAGTPDMLAQIMAPHRKK